MSPADPIPSDGTAASSPADGAAAGSPAVLPEAVPGLGLALLGSEVVVLFRRVRTIALLRRSRSIPILLAVAVRVTTDDDGSGGRGPAFLGDITQNGLFVSLTALTVAIPLFLPLTVGVVAGDTIAGEASLGTLRYLLVDPGGPGAPPAREVRRRRPVLPRRHARRGRRGGHHGRRPVPGRAGHVALGADDRRWATTRAACC